jgi:hypothetical protein
MKITFVIDEEDCAGVATELDRYLKKPITLEVLIDSARQMQELSRITPEQRAKIFALVKDIASYTGENAELQREQLMSAYCEDKQIEAFSLSDCSTDTAGDFINWLIEFAFEFGVPLKDVPISGNNEIEGYIKICAKNKKCIACGKDGVNYKINTDVSYCLCDTHYAEAKQGLEKFNEKYHFPQLD